MGKTGAAYLAAMGALRSGAGLVTVATPSTCLPIVASMGPAFMTVDLPDDARIRQDQRRAAGGGLSRSREREDRRAGKDQGR